MKTLQELYDEIIKSDELKRAYAEAVKGGKLADFLKARDCDATVEEVGEFLREKAGEDTPLSLDDMQKAAGGLCSTTADTRYTCTGDLCVTQNCAC